MNQDNIILICDCSSAEHQIIFRKMDDDNEFVYGSIHLSSRPFLKRIIPAIKYIFGYKCRYGHFDEILLGPQHISQVQDLAIKLQMLNKEDTTIPFEYDFVKNHTIACPTIELATKVVEIAFKQGFETGFMIDCWSRYRENTFFRFSLEKQMRYGNLNSGHYDGLPYIQASDFLKGEKQ